MDQIAHVLSSNKEAFRLKLKEKMQSASKHNWREKVFEYAMRAFLVDQGFDTEGERRYPGRLGLECDIVASRGICHFVEIKRFRSRKAFSVVTEWPYEDSAGELKGFPRDYLIDVSKVFMAASQDANRGGCAVAFIAFALDEAEQEIIKYTEISKVVSDKFNMNLNIVDIGEFVDTFNKPTRLLAVCIAS